MRSIATLQILNYDNDASTIPIIHLSSRESFTTNEYIVSDADEELLILVEFKQSVDLNSITLYGLPLNAENGEDDMSLPKRIDIYKIDSLNKDFDDINSIKTANKSYTCSSKKLMKGQTIKLKDKSKNAVKFKKIKFVAIYIKSNQQDTEKTYLNGIKFNGKDNSYESEKILINNKANDEQIYFDQSDKNNTKQLLEMNEEFSNIKFPRLFDSNGFLRTYDMKRHSKQCDDNQTDRNTIIDINCHLDECNGLARIAGALQRHHLLQNDNKIDVDSLYDEQYEHYQLLNDYHHLLTKHNHEFERIHRKLTTRSDHNKFCKLASCTMIQRAHRDRVELRDNNDKVKRMYHNSHHEDIVKQQYLDTIHCYISFHSFDIGFKFTTEQLSRMQQKFNSAVNDDSKQNDGTYNELIASISELITCKKHLYENVDGLKRLKQENTDRFTTSFNCDNFAENKDDSLPYYSVGYRYFYWKYYKDNLNLLDPVLMKKMIYPRCQLSANHNYTLGAWYIHSKYSELKDESLNNAVCTIGELQWNNYMKKAKDHMKTEHVKNIKCQQISYNISPFQVYGIRKGQSISSNHLIAMMIYCDEDMLQRSFTATYRKINSETDESLKTKHSNYFHLGRLLRELVECFGTVSLSNNLEPWGDITVYHGVSEKMQFSCLDTRFNGPTSTTTDFAVAVNFCGNTGMILQLQTDHFWAYKENNFAYFDCHWLSDFPNEQEIFCIGGFAAFSIASIVTSNGTDYGYYCNVLSLLGASFSGTRALWNEFFWLSVSNKMNEKKELA
eukprot:186924_1